MFERDGQGGAGSGQGRTPGRVLADQIRDRAVRIRTEQAGELLDATAWADLHSLDPTDRIATGPAGGVGKRVASDGTPVVDEYLAAEFAALRATSPWQGRQLLVDALDLRHRFPKLWTAATVELSVPAGLACKIARACRDLSAVAAGRVDTAVAGQLVGLPWGRAWTLVAAATLDADPELADRKLAEARGKRFVWMSKSEDGLRTLVARAEQGDVLLFYAAVDRIADILTLEGDLSPVAERRSRAIGILAQPAVATALLLRHTTDGQRARTTTRGRPGESADPPTGGTDRNSEQAGGTTDPGAETEPDEPTLDLDSDAVQPTGTDPDPEEASEQPDSRIPDGGATGGCSGESRDDDGGSGDDAGGQGDGTRGRGDEGPADDHGIPDPPETEDPPREEPPPGWPGPDDPDGPVDHLPPPWWDGGPPDPDPPPPTWTYPPNHQLDDDIDDDPCPDDAGPPRPRLDLNPDGLAALLTEQSLKAARPRVTCTVHLTDTTLATGEGVIRSADCGPMLASQLRAFLGDHSCAITVRPVLDPAHLAPVDSYEIPKAIRDAVRTRHPASVFPYSPSTSERMDLDHHTPYQPDGPPGQTHVDKLGPLLRSEHLIKTHARWTVHPIHRGVLIWRSPHGHEFLVTNHGTQYLGPKD